MELYAALRRLSTSIERDNHTSVHISLTFSKIILQCLSNALTLPNSFLLFLQFMSTCNKLVSILDGNNSTQRTCKRRHQAARIGPNSAPASCSLRWWSEQTAALSGRALPLSSPT